VVLQKQLFENLRRLAPKAKHLVLAVSGGSDSVGLLRLFFHQILAASNELNTTLLQRHHFQKLQKELNIKINIETIAVAHFDHALRETSHHDAIFVKKLCHTLGVPFYSERLEVAQIAREKKWNLEDAARRLRYAFLTRIAKQIKADAILTAHTLDDQAETVLMQLVRGSAYIKGMSAIQGQVFRPLLNISRQELKDYLSKLNQEYRIDESNLDTSKSRAWIRHEVLPILEQRYPEIKNTLAQLASIQQGLASHFEALSKKVTQSGIDLAEADISQLIKQDLATQRHIIAALGHQQMDFKHLEQIRENINSKNPIRISLPEGNTARIAYGKLSILTPFQQSSKLFPATARAFHSLDTYWLNTIRELADLEKLKHFENLELRSRQAGDRIQLSGGHKKVSDLLIDLKIPKEERGSIPMLASGKTVLWIKDIAADIRVANPFQDSDFTWMKQALELAQEAIGQGDLPVGCVIVKDNKLIAEAHNQTEYDKSPFAHAEILAMQRAAKTLHDWRLEGCTLYVTLEPCPMCFGAILQARIPKVVYGAKNIRDGALGSVIDMQDAPWKRSVEIRSGVLEKECRHLLSKFFRDQR
jgi:tRNA(Ile)-lysidine synthase